MLAGKRVVTSRSGVYQVSSSIVFDLAGLSLYVGSSSSASISLLSSQDWACTVQFINDTLHCVSEALVLVYLIGTPTIMLQPGF